MDRSCDTRVYEYLFPTYCLLPPTPNSKLAEHLRTFSSSGDSAEGSSSATAGDGVHSFWKDIPLEDYTYKRVSDLLNKNNANANANDKKDSPAADDTVVAAQGPAVADVVMEKAGGEGQGEEELDPELKEQYEKRRRMVERKRGYRASKEVVDRFRAVTQEFLGTQ